MALTGSMHLSCELGFQNRLRYLNQTKGQLNLLTAPSCYALRKDAWSLRLSNSMHGSITPVSSRCKFFLSQSVPVPGAGNQISVLKSASLILTRSCNALQGTPLVQLVPAVGIVAFATWGIGPLMRLSRNLFLNMQSIFFDRNVQKSDKGWKKSSTYYVMSYYLQPLLLWIGVMLICRALDPIILPSEDSQAIKQRLIFFIQSLSTALASAYCLSSLIEQVKELFIENNDSSDVRNIGFQFAGKAVNAAIWVAAVSLFMELLGFSTQNLLTAGGLGTVLLTLAGREVITNFLSSLIIHATRPFAVNERIQTKIKDSEVSGTIEHVGWWSPTIIRGDDRETVHIPNHKFAGNVVRNLSHRTHRRIKTHLAISYWDVNKINNIVADMRKVLSKNPLVEQKRLHRRVFLDYIDPDNQALLILVSCFVKTRRGEEYLCVKEAILLDLLTVVSHHRARLATPIRTVQKEYIEADMENILFSDTIFTCPQAADSHPVLQTEPSCKINGDDKIKAAPGSVCQKKEKDAKMRARAKSDLKPGSKAGASSKVDSAAAQIIAETDSKIQTDGSTPNDYEKQLP